MVRKVTLRLKLLSGLFIVLIVFTLFALYLLATFNKVISLSDELHSESNKSTLLADSANKATLSLQQEMLTTGKNVLVLAAAVVFLLTLFIGFYLISLVERSFEKLAVSVKEIASGNLQVRIPISAHDQIGKVGEAFNQMAEKLQQSYAGLEEKIAEKTKELSEKVTDLEKTKKAMLNVMQDLQIGRDTTERERLRYAAILESIGEGTIAVDSSGNVLLINPVAEQLLGISQMEMQTKKLLDAFQLYDESGTLIPVEKRPLSITLQTGDKVSQTVTYKQKDQTKIINITSTPIRLKEAIIGVIEIIRDITKEKQVDRMKTEFISLASHQLRTPLSAIRWFTEMLLGGDAGELNSEQKEFAQNISASTLRMIELVNSLLNISRIESGRILIDPKPTDLKELVEGLVKELQVSLNEKKHALIVSVHEDLPNVNVDAKLIRQVYLNLLTNAIKYTPKYGEISIFISKKDDLVISQITDNGYGIPKSEQGKIFQKFFRAANVSKLETDGTGLGLYLIKAIIESSHGKIWFQSPILIEKAADGKEVGRGTTFWFSLPMSGMQAKQGEVTLDG